ncbi:calcium-binding protein [Halobacterium salinarum]|uniref:calcium-binding protein n=1 Tax=Halobacterium salinarum TaxID=2242 RepID=UPI002552FA13|nr:calcium-binding protein [Halobacterium salinarum]MDL0135764.1 calcium-binding protein [Halobacterium salinarum]MDL0138225.1 calcium-binding protein [Halobacterium salinarum]
MTGETDKERDERIRNEIIVDAYTADEMAISWCYHLERQMSFPFQARCIEERTISPLREDEEVPVVGMTDEVVSSREMFVLVEWRDREFGVPLSQLEVLDVDSDTRQAVNDWHYWNGDGGRLG